VVKSLGQAPVVRPGGGVQIFRVAESSIWIINSNSIKVAHIVGINHFGIAGVMVILSALAVGKNTILSSKMVSSMSRK
jgi:hypothetical protein